MNLLCAQMSIRQMLAISMGTSPHTELAGPGAGGQVRRPHAAVPTRSDFWPRGSEDGEIPRGPMGGQLWGGVAAAGGRFEARHLGPMPVDNH